MTMTKYIHVSENLITLNHQSTTLNSQLQRCDANDKIIIIIIVVFPGELLLVLSWARTQCWSTIVIIYWPRELMSII